MRQAVALIGSIRRERRGLRSLPMEEVTTDQASAAEAVRWLGPIGIGGEPVQALYCHPSSAATFRIGVAPGDRITAGCALLPDVWDRNTGGVEFVVTVSSDGGALASARRIVDPGRRPRDRRWRPLRVSVPVSAAETVAVTLATRVPPGARPDHAWAVWGDPAIERPRTDIRAAVGALLLEVRHHGIRPALRRTLADSRVDDERARYRAWCQRQAPGREALARMADEVMRLDYQPRISIVTPAYNTPPDLLRACAASVLGQAYPNWEWCLCNDASSSAGTLAALGELTDPRIKVIHLDQNAGIALASQAALDAATGEFVAFLDSDDELTPDALFHVAGHLNASRDAGVIYSDEDKRDEDGGLSEPYFKPDWSPEHLLSAMYTCHLTVARKALVDRAGGFRKRCEGSQDHDLMLRLTDLTSRIDHLPRILYHWRRAPLSGATKAGAKPWADDAGRRAVDDYLNTKGLAAEVVSGGVPGLYRARFEIRDDPLVLVVVVGDRPVARTDLRLHPSIHAEVVAAPRSARAVGLAVGRSRAGHIVILDETLEPSDDQWVTALLEYSQQPAIGAVGGKVQYADGRIRHIGLLLGVGRGVARAMHGHPGASYGYFSSAIGVRNYSAVSAECLMTRRGVFEAAGGLSEDLPWSVADVDYCLRVRQAGHRVVFTPYARLRVRHDASAPDTEPSPDAIGHLRARWGEGIHADPYFNPNLDRSTGSYLIG